MKYRISAAPILVTLALIVGIGASTWKSLEWIDAYRLQHFCERADVSGGNYETTREDVEERCSRSPPTSTDSSPATVEQPKENHEREWYDLRAQQDMAEWGLGMFLATVVGLAISGAGLLALVLTFYEQRQLTQNESCAYLEIVRAEILMSPMFGMTYRLHIRNNGHTPAKEIVAKVQYVFFEERKTSDPLKEKRSTLYLTSDELPADKPGFIQATSTDLLDLPGLYSEMGSAYDRFGVLVEEENSTYSPAELRFDGELTYRDVYRRKHHIPIRQYTHSLKTGIFGSGTESRRSVLST